MSPNARIIPLNTEREVAVKIAPDAMTLWLLSRSAGDTEWTSSVMLGGEELRNLGYGLIRQPGGDLLLAAIQSGFHDAR